MSLATRCTSCTTVFRVVQDQLKVSEGWVRCGRCSHVFNALEGLFDLERNTQPLLAEGGTDDKAAADAPPAAAEAQASPPEPADLPQASPAPQAFSDKIDAQLRGSRATRGASTPAKRVSERDRLDFPDAQFDTEALAEDPPPPSDATASTVPTITETQSDAPAAAASDAVTAEPSFIRRAQWQARQRRPAARVAQVLAGVLLAAGLSAQAAHHFRDSIAARWPVTEGALSAWCRLAACTIAPPRHIDDVVVESTALARAEAAGGADAANALRLSVVLRNRGMGVVATPSIDLSLTDAAGLLVSRRMLAPRDFQTAPETIRPGVESTMQLVFAVDSAPVAGYTVEVFYP